MTINAGVIRDKFEDFVDERTANKRFVIVKGKKPVRPGTENPIEWRKTDNRYCWDQVTKIPGDGYGIILDKTGLTCLDFDKCLNDNGLIVNERVEKIVHDLGTWVEVSSSGKGLHAWVITDANTPNTKYHDQGIEVITDGHVKLTGKSYPSASENKIELIDAERLFDILGVKKSLSGSGVGIRGKFSDGPILSGARNATLFSMGAALRNRGLSSEGIYAALSSENKSRCTPPLDDDEIRRISLSAGEYPVGNREQVAQTGGNAPVVVNVNTEKHSLTEHTDICIEAIVRNYNTPNKRLFVRAGVLSAIMYDEKGNVKIGEMNEFNIKYILDLCCNFVTFKKIKTKDGEDRFETIKARPIPDVSKNIISGIDIYKKFPPLLGIVEAPYITGPGEVITDPGYSEKTKFFFAPGSDYKKIEIPDTPTPEQVAAAVDHIGDLISDFMFDGETKKPESKESPGRHNAIAALFTAVLRPAIDGCTPLYLVDKPQMGTGGSLLCEIINRIATGRALSPSNAPRSNDKDEWEKMIISVLQSGTGHICFDNIEGALKSSSLSSVLTMRKKKGRVLGSTNDTSFDVCVNWMGNGINLDIKGDLLRRIYLSRLITDVARPQQRTDFKIPDIKKHTLDHRYEYLKDVLTIARAYHAAGCPKPEWVDEKGKRKEIPAMGSFEEWRNYIGGIMVFIKKYRFMDNTEDVLTQYESMSSDDEVLLEAIHNSPKDQLAGEFTASQVIKAAYEHQDGELFRSLPGYIMADQTEASRSKKLGKHFASIRGKVFPAGYSIRQMRIVMHAVRWSINYDQQNISGQQSL
jgi:hypothetical protein